MFSFVRKCEIFDVWDDVIVHKSPQRWIKTKNLGKKDIKNMSKHYWIYPYSLNYDIVVEIVGVSVLVGYCIVWAKVTRVRTTCFFISTANFWTRLVCCLAIKKRWSRNLLWGRGMGLQHFFYGKFSRFPTSLIYNEHRYQTRNELSFLVMFHFYQSLRENVEILRVLK